MVFALPGGILALLALLGCNGAIDPTLAWPVSEVTKISTDRVEIGTEERPITYKAPPPFVRFEIQNTGASTLFVSPALSEAKVVDNDSRLADWEVASLVVVDLPPFTAVLPGQRKPLQVTLDDRPWRWSSGTYHVRFPFEARYFYSGQEITEAEDATRAVPPEVIAELFWLDVHVVIDCDLDDDGFDEFICGGDDADELDPGRRPDAVEVCDHKDNDLDGAVDEYAVNRKEWCYDHDGDGFGDPDQCVIACDPPAKTKWVYKDEYDCDDDKIEVRPSVAEFACADGLDNDCDGKIDGADSDCQ